MRRVRSTNHSIDDNKRNIRYSHGRGRKHAPLIAASILTARKLAQYDGGAGVDTTIDPMCAGIVVAPDLARRIAVWRSASSIPREGCIGVR